MDIILAAPRTGSTVTKKIIKNFSNNAERFHYCFYNGEKMVFESGNSEHQFFEVKPSNVNNLIYIRRNIVDAAISQVFHEKFSDPVNLKSQSDRRRVANFINSSEFIVNFSDTITLNFLKNYIPFAYWPSHKTKKFCIEYKDLVANQESYLDSITQIYASKLETGWTKKIAAILKQDLEKYPNSLTHQQTSPQSLFNTQTKTIIYDYVVPYLNENINCYSQIQDFKINNKALANDISNLMEWHNKNEEL